jgi:hypothetical protein
MIVDLARTPFLALLYSTYDLHMGVRYLHRWRCHFEVAYCFGVMVAYHGMACGMALTDGVTILVEHLLLVLPVDMHR